MVKKLSHKVDLYDNKPGKAHMSADQGEVLSNFIDIKWK